MTHPQPEFAAESKSLTLATLVVLAIARAALAPAAQAAPPSTLAYIGTHGSASWGPSASDQQGIYAARLDPATGHLSLIGLAAHLERATWLTVHPKLPILYSVADTGAGFKANSRIHTFAIDGPSGALKDLGAVDAGGIDATHLALDSETNTLLSANHGSGTVTALPVGPDGKLGAPVSIGTDYGTGPNPRQKSAQAHGVTVDPTHHWVLVADFGADRIFVYQFNPEDRRLTPAHTPYEPLPPGSGTRHLLFLPNGKNLLVDSELTAELRSYQWNAHWGRLLLVQTLSTYPEHYTGEKSAAEIATSRDGRFAYVSLRGDQDSIVAYAVDPENGTLKEIQRSASQGKNPWSFAIDPSGRWMLVTNEASNTVTVLAVDPSTGHLSPTNESLSVPRPVTVAFYRTH